MTVRLCVEFLFLNPEDPSVSSHLPFLRRSPFGGLCAGHCRAAQVETFCEQLHLHGPWAWHVHRIILRRETSSSFGDGHRFGNTPKSLAQLVK